MLPIKGGKSSLRKTLALSLIISAMLILLAVATASAETAQADDLLYVCNGNNVSILNATNMSAVRTLSFGSDQMPSYVALSPGGTTMYVVSAANDRLLVVDMASNKIIRTVTLASFAGEPQAACSAISVSPDGMRIYINDFQTGTLRIINATSYSQIAAVDVGSVPLGLAISPDGRYAYVANSGSGSISVVDLSSCSVIGNVTGGNGTFGVCLSPDGRRLYATNWYGGDVMICDAFNGSILGRIQVNHWITDSDHGLANIRVSPDGTTLYVVNAYDNTVVMIKAASGTIYKTVNVGRYPREMELSPDGTRLFVSLIDAGKLCAISLPEGNVTFRDTAPYTPLGLAFSSANWHPSPTPAPNATVTPAPTPSFGPSPSPVPTPTPTPVPITTTVTPTAQPAYMPIVSFQPIYTPTYNPTEQPDVTTRPYFTTGWELPELDLSTENMMLCGGALIIVLGILGVIGYVSVSRQLRPPEEEGDEYEDEDEDQPAPPGLLDRLKKKK